MSGDNNLLDTLFLKRNWDLWFDSPNFHENYKNYLNLEKWKENLQYVYHIKCIKSFWCTYNNIINVDEMWYKSAYYFIVSNGANHTDLNHINKNMINIFVPNNIDQNDIWTYIVLSILGESTPYNESIIGTSIIKCKNYFEISLYLKTNDRIIIEFIIEYFLEEFQKKNILPFIEYFIQE